MNKLIITFYNEWHNGDVHMSRNYVKDLMNIIGPQHKYYYYHKNNISLLSDIPNLTSTNYRPEETNVYIDTWIGQDIHNGMEFKGCNFLSYYEVMGRLYDKLGIKSHLKDIVSYIPTIDYSFFDIKNIVEYFEKNKNPHVLICNNDVHSGQAPQFCFNFLIEELSNSYPDITFICSNNIENKNANKNVIMAKDIIKKNNNESDLNEISFLSSKCKCVIGRSSGPYTFSLTKENILNTKFICFCYKKEDSWFLNSQDNAYPIWSNNFYPQNIIDMSKNILNVL